MSLNNGGWGFGSIKSEGGDSATEAERSGSTGTYGFLGKRRQSPLATRYYSPFFFFNSLSAYCHIPSQINLATTRRRGPTITFQSWYAHALVDIHAHAFPFNTNMHFTTSSRRWR